LCGEKVLHAAEKNILSEIFGPKIAEQSILMSFLPFIGTIPEATLPH
jgi:hypothetical protein